RMRHRVDEINLKEKTIAGTQLDTGNRFTNHYDRLVLATGSQAIRPRIEGLELKNVFFLRSIFDADRILPAAASENVRNVVVVGGGYIGLEMAESLIERGKKVTLVELAPQILTLFDEDLAGLVRKHLEKKGVQVFTGEGLKAIHGKDGQVARVQTASREIPAEAVLLSLGVRPQAELARKAGLRIGATGAIWVNERMETSAEGVFAAGDCAETANMVTGKKTWVPLGSTANKQGRVVGINVCGGKATFPGVLGTAVFKAFDFNVAKTGLNMKEALTEGFTPIQAVVRGYDRAHYYPGMKESVLKVIADQKTGLLLGAQAAGEGPSDKFIDIVAMALLGRMDCEKLGAADLAYAPPFSPALSPVLSAAHVLQNKREKIFEWTTAAEVKKKLDAGQKEFLVLDVRDEKEVKERRIPGSTWVSLDQLGKNLAKLDKGKEISVHCHSGVRSYKAYLQLKHAGFDNIKNIDGGLLCWTYETEGPQ
ncbi:MAG: FAD-dependent oxidoreductase, partial [Deltaproteobacteria bacterium]|nr:FAD-dependent oxidoreductase [Deltaproteobacteria bacterium]